MKGRPRPIYPPNNAPPTPPSEQPVIDAPTRQTVQAVEVPELRRDEVNSYEDQDTEVLFENAEQLLAVPEEDLPMRFRKWHKQHLVGSYRAS